VSEPGLIRRGFLCPVGRPRLAAYRGNVMDLNFNEAEFACLKKLADLFERGHDFCSGMKTEEIGLTKQNRYAVLRMLEQHQYIRDPIHTAGNPSGGGGHYSSFCINASTVQTVRVIEEAARKKTERKDFVDQVKEAARKHPILGPLILIVVVLGGVVTVLNQFISLLKNLGWIQ